MEDKNNKWCLNFTQGSDSYGGQISCAKSLKRLLARLQSLRKSKEQQQAQSVRDGSGTEEHIRLYRADFAWLVDRFDECILEQNSPSTPTLASEPQVQHRNESIAAKIATLEGPGQNGAGKWTIVLGSGANPTQDQAEAMLAMWESVACCLVESKSQLLADQSELPNLTINLPPALPNAHLLVCCQWVRYGDSPPRLELWSHAHPFPQPVALPSTSPSAFPSLSRAPPLPLLLPPKPLAPLSPTIVGPVAPHPPTLSDSASDLTGTQDVEIVQVQQTQQMVNAGVGIATGNEGSGGIGPSALGPSLTQDHLHPVANNSYEDHAKAIRVVMGLPEMATDWTFHTYQEIVIGWFGGNIPLNQSTLPTTTRGVLSLPGLNPNITTPVLTGSPSNLTNCPDLYLFDPGAQSTTTATSPAQSTSISTTTSTTIACATLIGTVSTNATFATATADCEKLLTSHNNNKNNNNNKQLSAEQDQYRLLDPEQQSHPQEKINHQQMPVLSRQHSQSEGSIAKEYTNNDSPQSHHPDDDQQQNKNLKYYGSTGRNGEVIDVEVRPVSVSISTESAVSPRSTMSSDTRSLSVEVPEDNREDGSDRRMLMVERKGLQLVSPSQRSRRASFPNLPDYSMFKHCHDCGYTHLIRPHRGAGVCGLESAGWTAGAPKPITTLSIDPDRSPDRSPSPSHDDVANLPNFHRPTFHSLADLPASPLHLVDKSYFLFPALNFPRPPRSVSSPRLGTTRPHRRNPPLSRRVNSERASMRSSRSPPRLISTLSTGPPCAVSPIGDALFLEDV